MREPWHEDQVGYTAESPLRAYTADIRAATSRDDLLARLGRWRRLCPDAYRQAEAALFEDVQWALRHSLSERHAERVHAVAGAIILPAVPCLVSLIAAQFHAPWGTAFIRAQEVGLLRQNASGEWEVV